MNGYFIHTFEMSQRIIYDDYTTLKEKLSCYPDEEVKDKQLYPFKSTRYSKDGIIIKLQMCTDNERKKNEGACFYKITMIINPSRLLREGTYVNCIDDKYQMEEAIDNLDCKLKDIFASSGFSYTDINDFRLSRIDLTKDIRNIPDDVIQQLMDILWRMPLCAGYKENTGIQVNCVAFDKTKSFNVENNSRGIEFVIYDKRKATEDWNYPEEAQEYYQNTIRMELRCKRKYIRKEIQKKTDMKRAILDMYLSAQDAIHDIYSSIFCYTTDLSYLSPRVMGILLEKKTGTKKGTKKGKRQKMSNLVRVMSRKEAVNLTDAMERMFRSEKQQSKIRWYFTEMCVSPVVIRDENVPFLQSLDSLLEFRTTCEDERKLYRFAEKHTRGKEVFLHA